MGCCHYFAPAEGGDRAFTVDVSMITFGAGCLDEAGDRARSMGLKRVALMTDKGVLSLGHMDRLRDPLTDAGVALWRCGRPATALPQAPVWSAPQ